MVWALNEVSSVKIIIMRTIFFGAALVAVLSFVTQSNAISLDDSPVFVPDYLSQIEVEAEGVLRGDISEANWHRMFESMSSIPKQQGEMNEEK